MTLKTLAYLLYLAITVPLTIYVARTLFRNGKVFLHDVFNGNDALADAVNRLLVVGFYLFNLGYVALFMQNDETIENTEQLSGGAVDPGRPRRHGARRRAPGQRVGVQPHPPPRRDRAAVGPAGRARHLHNGEPVILTVLYDEACPVCRRARRWVEVLWAVASTRHLANDVAMGRKRRLFGGIKGATEWVRRMTANEVDPGPWPPPSPRVLR